MTDELLDLQRIAEQAVGLGYDIVKNTTPAEIRLKSDRDVVARYLNLRYAAAKGHGAFGNHVQLHASKATSLAESIVSIGDYAVSEDAAAKNERRIRVTMRLAEQVERVRMLGSAALDLAWVTEGRTDATVILVNKPWDTAAGAKVVDATGASHSFESKKTIATSPRITSAVLAVVNDA